MIRGHHHISMFTKDLKENNHFYTGILGLRRVKISVNQGDTGMYHVFYGDMTGTAGNDLTFFEIPNIGATHKGTNSISGIGLLVSSYDSLLYWRDRLDRFNVKHKGIGEYADRDALVFEDHEGLKLMLINHDGGNIPDDWNPWDDNGIEEAHRILGMGTAEITVENKDSLVSLLENVFGYTLVSEDGTKAIVQAAESEVFGEIQILESSGNKEKPGRGSVHHLAIQSAERPLGEWDRILKDKGYVTTGVKNRYYFNSLYFREDNGVMIEIVGAEARGFTADASVEELGTKLDLPSFLEDQRNEIESRLRPIEEWT
ncbi:VOC family protein [Salinicoccus sp. HZC-1]|uniref:VOC family protein n=1 Tax=Salinicoccus sp. HZC-1 TaxID=3385497 RepID=UPI00398ACF4A